MMDTASTAAWSSDPWCAPEQGPREAHPACTVLGCWYAAGACSVHAHPSIPLASPPQSGAAWSIYIGQGSGGLATGLGVMLTGAGDWYAGSWRDGAVWGRGLHVFSPPAAGGGGPSQAWRRDFAGSFDGQPFGLGRATWWDGRQEHGRFHGTQLVEQVGRDRVDEVVGSALQSARAACRHARRLWLRIDSEHAAFAAQCLAQAPDLPSALSRIDQYDMSE